MTPIAIDFETFYRAGKTATPSVTSQGTWKYTHDPEFEVLIVSVTDGESYWAGEPKDFYWESLRGRRLISHNAAFDRAVYRRLVEDKLAPAGLDADWNCSANLVAYFSGGRIRSIKDAAKEWLGMEVSKAVRDNLSGKRVADLKRDGSWQATLDYAKDDVVECLALWNLLSPRWPEVEYDMSLLTMEHSEYGVTVDIDRMNRDIASMQEAIWATDRVIPWVAAGRKPGSPVALAEACRDAGIETPPTKEEDEEGFILWESKYGPIYPWVRAVSRRRSLTKVLAGHEHIKSRIRSDGRFDFGLLYFGAHTGRWSGTGGFNMQNLRANPLVVDLSKHGEVIPAKEAKRRKLAADDGPVRVIDPRALFVPQAGHDMVLVDLAQIEPRVLHWCTGNTEMLEKVAGGMSVYEAYSRVTPRGKPYWTEPGEMKKEVPLLYKAIKIQVLQLGYGSGWQTYLSQALENDLEMDEETAKKVVEEFRSVNKPIVDLWDELGKGLREAAAGSYLPDRQNGQFIVDLPSGRQLVYKNLARRIQKSEVDENGKTKVKWGISAQVGKKTAFLYGGKLVENLIQAAARDVFAAKLYGLRKMGIRMLWTIHDEVVMEIPTPSKPSHSSILHEFRKPVEWLPNCPLDAELSVVPHYQK